MPNALFDAASRFFVFFFFFAKIGTASVLLLTVAVIHIRSTFCYFPQLFNEACADNVTFTHFKLPPRSGHFVIELSGKTKWLPLNFGYHDVMRTAPSHLHGTLWSAAEWCLIVGNEPRE